MLRSRVGAVLLASGAALVAACSSESPGCAPTDPGCNQTDPTVSAVSVEAEIDTVMAVGRTTQLSATATDRDDNPISTSFTWSSSSTSVATVDADGTVSAVGPGSASIEASANGEAGTWQLTVVDADLTGVADLLQDPFVEALIQSLDTEPGSSLSDLLTRCEVDLDSGDVLAIRACLTGAADVESSNATNDPALAVLDLVFQESLRKLRLDS